MPHRWSSESSQEVSPPGSIKSDSSGSQRGKREKVKEVIDHFLNKFQRRRRDSSDSRASVERRKSRPQSLVAISTDRPAPIAVSVVPHMDSYSSSTSKRGKLFRRFSISSASDSIRSEGSECSNSSLMQRVQDAVRPESNTISHEVDTSADKPAPTSDSNASSTAADMATQTEPAGLEESMVVVPSQQPDEPTESLTAEEESVASLSPGLPPMLTPDADVDCLNFDVPELPVTPPARTPETHFVLPTIVEHMESTHGEPVIAAATDVDVSSSKKDIVAITRVPSTVKQEDKPSPVAPQTPPREEAPKPTFSQYLYNLVAPESLDSIRQPIGYSLTALCYGLTWYLVTQTPGQAFI
ncbi:hypothetical protein BC835DRAFT_1410081 [Cytidiella melzeri]|nr:hypothetical protein BC835DRAFT_1410081 [Cytidiella melzeri]